MSESDYDDSRDDALLQSANQYSSSSSEDDSSDGYSLSFKSQQEPSEKSPSPEVNDVPFKIDPPRKYLDDLNKIKHSSNLRREFQEYCHTFKKDYFVFTPEQRRKARLLDIEIDECNFECDPTSEFAKQDQFIIIEENWKSFCEDYGFDPKNDLNLFYFAHSKTMCIITDKQKELFKRYLALHLPFKQIDLVYSKFMSKLFFTRTLASFTAEEDELLLLWHEVSENTKPLLKNPGVLAIILQRPIRILNARLSFLLAGEQFKIPSTFLPVSQVEEKKRNRQMFGQWLMDIKNRDNEDYPDWAMDEGSWKEIETIDGRTTAQVLKKTYFRKLWPSARVNKPDLKRTEFINSLLFQLYSLKKPTWENVDWKELGRVCFNVGAVRVYSALRKLVKLYVPSEKWNDLEACLMSIAVSLTPKNLHLTFQVGIWEAIWEEPI